MKLPVCLAPMERNIWGQRIWQHTQGWFTYPRAAVASPAIYPIKVAYCHPALLANHPFTVTTSSAAHGNSPLLGQYQKELAYCRRPLLLAHIDKVQNRKAELGDSEGQVAGRENLSKLWDHCGDLAVLEGEEPLKICCLPVSTRQGSCPGQHGTHPPKDAWGIQGGWEPS